MVHSRLEHVTTTLCPIEENAVCSVMGQGEAMPPWVWVGRGLWQKRRGEPVASCPLRGKHLQARAQEPGKVKIHTSFQWSFLQSFSAAVDGAGLTASIW